MRLVGIRDSQEPPTPSWVAVRVILLTAALFLIVGGAVIIPQWMKSDATALVNRIPGIVASMVDKSDGGQATGLSVGRQYIELTTVRDKTVLRQTWVQGHEESGTATWDIGDGPLVFDLGVLDVDHAAELLQQDKSIEMFSASASLDPQKPDVKLFPVDGDPRSVTTGFRSP